DWLYDHFGVYAWTVELWSPQAQAGIKDFKYIDWFREHPVEDDLKLLQWSDETLGGQGYVDWYAFEHPQLGPVELGGWNNLYAWRNPPPPFLEKEIAPFSDWLIWHLLISPRLEIYRLETESLGGGAHRITLALHNTGWLPTAVTKRAVEKKAARGVVCEIELPDGAELKIGKRREELGQLEGRAYTPSSVSGGFLMRFNSDDRAKVEWVVSAPQGGLVRLSARHERAGTVRAEVNLPAEG
ncbi:MAG: carboxypeptidase, partial [Anaerolineae bacterium]|nr:carboxypeptidase [Anaerolineae bacterium]